MELGQQTDGELLANYRGGGQETAFAELVRRHLNLVYGAAFRQLGGDRAAAEDVAQLVFLELAAQSSRLVQHPSLAGWLYTTTRHKAGHVRRERQRREKREQETMNHPDQSQDPSETWEQLRPVIDDAMERLSGEDRLAVLLRYFEDRELKDVGSALGLSDNAARMRVQRALEKLRIQLQRRGVTTTSAALAACLAAHSTSAAPATLGAQIAATSLSVIPVLASSTASTLTLPWITTMKSSITYAIGALLVAGPILFQELQIHRANASLAQLTKDLAASNRPDDAGETNRRRQQAALAELEQLRREAMELQQLQTESRSFGTGLDSQRLARLTAASQRLQAAEAELGLAEEETETRALRVKTINSMKHLGLGARIFATDNADQFPTNFSQIQAILGTNAPGGIPIDKFDYYPQPRVISEREPQLFLFVEKQPRKRTDGQWERVYGLADGSVQSAVSPTADFSQWEKDNQGIASPLPPK